MKLQYWRYIRRVDVVYILGKGSKWRDNEIRYSIRSLVKHLKGFDKIFIAGECPSFLQNVIHIPVQDVPGRKQYSIFLKELAAAKDERVSEEYLAIHDDHFFCADMNLNEWGDNYRDEKDLGYWAERYKGKYRQHTLNTIGYCDEDWPFYDIHVPGVHLNTVLLEMESRVDWSKEYLVKTLVEYFTMPLYFAAEPKITDLKINKKLTKAEIYTKIKDRFCFSVGDYGICPDMKAVLNELYPEPSIYEK